MDLYLFLGVGTLAMFFAMFLCRKKYQIPVWKTVCLCILLTAIGLLGTKIMAFIESGSFAGRSFFGAVFLIPVLMSVLALAFREKISAVLDMTAPSVCVMLALMKVKCLIDGCCGGKVIYHNSQFQPVFFPSQAVEAAVALCIAILLIILILKGKFVGEIYPVFMIGYGITRFGLNFFRYAYRPIFIGLAVGNIWALVSIAVGVIWIAVSVVRKKKKGACK